jgi:hypothetical protein
MTIFINSKAEIVIYAIKIKEETNVPVGSKHSEGLS